MAVAGREMGMEGPRLAGKALAPGNPFAAGCPLDDGSGAGGGNWAKEVDAPNNKPAPANHNRPRMRCLRTTAKQDASGYIGRSGYAGCGNLPSRDRQRATGFGRSLTLAARITKNQPPR